MVSIKCFILFYLNSSKRYLISEHCPVSRVSAFRQSIDEQPFDRTILFNDSIDEMKVIGEWQSICVVFICAGEINQPQIDHINDSFVAVVVAFIKFVLLCFALVC